MGRLWDAIDLHVAVMLVLLAPVACVSCWWLVVPLLVPQGRISVRAFWDLPTLGERRWVYLAANELLVLSTVGSLGTACFLLSMQ